MPSISAALFANLSPKYPAATVVNHPANCRENARVPNCVPVRPRPNLISGSKIVDSPELYMCLMACPRTTVTAN